MADTMKDILKLGWKLELATNDDNAERYIFTKDFLFDDNEPDSFITREVDIDCDKKLKSTAMYFRISERWAARYLTMPELDVFYAFMKERDNEMRKNSN